MSRVTELDNFGTLILFFEGVCSDEGKARQMSSRLANTVTGGKTYYRVEYKWIDKDHFTYAGYMDSGDGEFKNMHITFERQ